MKYRSREEVEAIEYRDDNQQEVIDWIEGLTGSVTIGKYPGEVITTRLTGDANYKVFHPGVVFVSSEGSLEAFGVDVFNSQFEPVKSYATGGYVGKGEMPMNFDRSCYFPGFPKPPVVPPPSRPPTNVTREAG